jgi:hypothetical protein
MQHKPDNQASKELVDFLLNELNLTGLQEIMSEKRVEILFARLFRERGLYIGRVNRVSAFKQELLSCGTCPYCQTLIPDDANQVFCKSCGIPHHDECWQENGHCAVFGCGQMESLKTGLEQKEEQSLIVLGEDDLGDEAEENQAKEYEEDHTILWITIGGLFLFLVFVLLSGC